MSELEYMSSAGFRACSPPKGIANATTAVSWFWSNVPERIREALELAGFTELFKIFDDPRSGW
jgi:hypothetical protein